MKIEQFDFELPAEAIALRPVRPRDRARMLVLHADGAIEHRTVRDLPEYLDPGDVVVANDSRVICARLQGRRLPRGQDDKATTIEVTLHERVAPNSYRAFAKPARKLAVGDKMVFGECLEADVTDRLEGGNTTLVFTLSGRALDDVLSTQGQMPLPPYIARRRKPDAQDFEDYQTVFARELGSVAAPTAGLHFTPNLRQRLAERGVLEEHVTLHVGAGTFLPVKTDDTRDHLMHAELGRLSEAAARTLNVRRAAGSRISAVGTTSLRTLESACDPNGTFSAFSEQITLFITPGYRFRGTDLLLTNFHLPRSTLFMLVAAFCGLERIKAAYADAIRLGYRFYSYGDACLLYPAVP